MGNKENSYTIAIYKGRQLPGKYLNFVISKWARSYRYGNDYIKLTDSDAYFQAYSNFICKVLSQDVTTTRIASLTSDDDVALGFSVSRGNILDYLHVHKDMRRQGIGTHLMPKEVASFTHLTRVGLRLWSTKLPMAVFNPFT